MVTELVGQGCFGCLWFSLGMITPAGQFIRDEFKKRISGSSRKLDLWFELACFDDDWGICKHHVARSEALPPQIGQGFVRIAEGHGA